MPGLLRRSPRSATERRAARRDVAVDRAGRGRRGAGRRRSARPRAAASRPGRRGRGAAGRGRSSRRPARAGCRGCRPTGRASRRGRTSRGRPCPASRRARRRRRRARRRLGRRTVAWSPEAPRTAYLHWSEKSSSTTGTMTSWPGREERLDEATGRRLVRQRLVDGDPRGLRHEAAARPRPAPAGRGRAGPSGAQLAPPRPRGVTQVTLGRRRSRRAHSAHSGAAHTAHRKVMAMSDQGLQASVAPDARTGPRSRGHQGLRALLRAAAGRRAGNDPRGLHRAPRRGAGPAARSRSPTRRPARRCRRPRSSSSTAASAPAWA